MADIAAPLSGFWNGNPRLGRPGNGGEALLVDGARESQRDRTRRGHGHQQVVPGTVRGLLLWRPCLERQTNREDGVVITCMEAGRRDLVSAANRESHSSPETKSSENQSRRYEILLLTVVRPVLKEH